MQAQARDAAGGNAAPKTRRNAVATALPAGNVEPPLGATITEHTMITLTVAVAGKPYRKSPEALVELAHWAMLRYAQAWAAKRHTSAEKFFFAAERATREAKAIITCRSIRQAYSSQPMQNI